MRSLSFNAGNVIIKKGELEMCAYVIESGKVEVSNIVNNKKTVLAVLGKPQIFGEMGLIEDKPRSATVTALEKTKLSMISRNAFNELFEKNPKVLLPIIKALFERLRTANKLIVGQSMESSASKWHEHKQTATIQEVTKPTVETKPIEKTVPTEETKSIEEAIQEAPYLKGDAYLSGLNEASIEALNGKEMMLNQFPFKIGRDQGSSSGIDIFSDNNLYLKDSPPFNVSRNHFLINKIDGRFIIVDRGSSLGTLVNGEKIEDQYVLTECKNEIAIGTILSPFMFKLEIK